ncbi:MAG: SGNH/GDSL hydrolase family protein [Thermoleophilaceae bacterium]|nr:SGNH/GDSL hydrolase family protein [Thermoleophilaceae bacterium]
MQSLNPRILAPALALIALAVAAIAPVDAGAAGRYVAFGDSNATGSGLDGSNTQAPCYRTQNSYPEFIAAALARSDFESAACSGAGITEFTNPFTAVGDVAPQFDSLHGSETLVTITIGANDSGYGVYKDACLKNPNLNTTPCKDQYVANGVNSLVTSARNALTNRLGPAIDEIHRRAPMAEVWVIGYARLIPVDVTNCPGRIEVSAGDAPVFNAWQVAVNDYARAETESHDAYYVDVFTPSAGHDGCQSDPAARWTNPKFDAMPANAGWDFHPTLAGESAMYQLFIDAFNSPRPIRPPRGGNATTPIGQTLSIRFGAKKVRPVTAKVAPITSSAPSRYGAKLGVTLARSGTVQFLIERAKPGHVKNGKCRALSKRASNGRKACTRYLRLSSKVTLSLPGGSSTVYFTGRADGKRLSAGRYRLRAELGSLSAKTRTFLLSN